MCESPAEIELYYLKSHYYDPKICRFINADGLASTGQGFLGCNMFAYCLNNPVNGADPSGQKVNNLVVMSDGGGKKRDPSYELINGQGLEPYNSIPYGISTVGFSGCESIAIYNALILIGEARSLQTVMTYMLQSINDGGGYGLCGLGGGTMRDIMRTLTILNVDYCLADYDTLCNVEEPTVMIVGFWTKTTIEIPIIKVQVKVPSIHTVAINYSGGTYCAYNYYSNSLDAELNSEFGALVNGKEKYLYGFIINK